MKAVTIPRSSDPFIVNINNKEYRYRAGETIEVPDEVAEAIENHQDIHNTLQTPKILTGGSTLVVEANEDRTMIVTPLNAIRDAWLSGRLVILPLSRNGYTNVFILATGGVSVDNGNFLSARFVRVSETGVETYTVDQSGKLFYALLQ